MDAGLEELELVLTEIQSLEFIMKDPFCTDLARMCAMLRLNIMLDGKDSLEKIIASELSRLDINKILGDIQAAR